MKLLINYFNKTGMKRPHRQLFLKMVAIRQKLHLPEKGLFYTKYLLRTYWFSYNTLIFSPQIDKSVNGERSSEIEHLLLKYDSTAINEEIPF